jgi:lysophospholipase L1-like esterase
MFTNGADYPSMLENGTDLICHNVGFTGTTLTDHNGTTYIPFSMNRLADAVTSRDFSSQDKNATTIGGVFPTRLNTLKSIDFSEVDFVTLFYGTNDWGYNKILKSADDTAAANKQRTNVEDALKYSIKTLLTAYPHLQIVVITPYWRSAGAGLDSDVNANGAGVYLYEYADYIQKVAEESYHVPTINLYRTSGVNAITKRHYTSDGTHPTERMKHIIASRILHTINENR